ncbi:MAG: hypothetical protein CNLJKLNK_00414 [Holosporales bacterium]
MANTLQIKNYLNAHPMLIRTLSALGIFTLLAIVLQMGPVAFGIGMILLTCGILYEIFSIRSHKSMFIKLVFSLYSMGAVLCIYLVYLKMGAVYFLWLVGLVTFNDTAALFVGKNLQGPKLCPKISPNKTISGFFGGVIIGSVFSVVLASFLNLTFSFRVGIIALFLSFASHTGDILESVFKRYFHIKDSGHLIPGHGGILDRMDSLMFVNVVFYCIIK